MIGMEEEVISSIEEIDNSFSSINRTLKEILGTIDGMAKKNKQVTENCAPWLRFFGASTDIAEAKSMGLPVDSGLDAEVPECVESPLMMRFSSPKNPFIDSTSSEIMNKTLLGDLGRRLSSNPGCPSTSSSIPLPRPELESSESDSSVLLPFNAEDIPSSFRSEKELFTLYELIAAGNGVSHEDISRCLPGLPPEKLSIFIELLLRKRYIGRRKNKFVAY
jgi:hypothetical protein